MLVLIGLAAIVILVFILIGTSDRYRFYQAVRHKDNADKAIEYLSKVNDPESDYFCNSKFILGELLYEKGLYEEAKEAYNAAVYSNAWEDMDVYTAVADYLISGARGKSLAVDNKKAADLYSASPQFMHKHLAGELYYELGCYNDAYRMFSEIAKDKGTAYAASANGYVGLMYLYGQAGLEADVMEAWIRLKDAPDEDVFASAKGKLKEELGISSDTVNEVNL